MPARMILRAVIRSAKDPSVLSLARFRYGEQRLAHENQKSLVADKP